MDQSNKSAFSPPETRPGMMKQKRTNSVIDHDYSPSGALVSARKTEASHNFNAQMASQSMAMPGSSAPTRFPTFTQNSNNNRLLDQPTLPTDFNQKGIRLQENDCCQLCEITFTGKLKVMNRVSMKNCKRCGRAVCETCSDQRRQLSLNDTELHRVCDKCDTEMDNFRLKRNHEDVLAAQKKKIEMLNNQLVQLEEDKTRLDDDCNAEMKQLQTQVRNKYNKRDELTDRLSDMKQSITNQNNARNLLHKSICDLENVIADLEVEQKRLMTKQNLVQTQTNDLQHQLRHKQMQNEQEQKRLDALKTKLGK